MMGMTQTVTCACWRWALVSKCFMDTACQSSQSNNQQNNNASKNPKKSKKMRYVWFILINVWEARSKLVQVSYHRHQISFLISSPLYDRGVWKERDVYPPYEGPVTADTQQSCSALESQGRPLCSPSVGALRDGGGCRRMLHSSCTHPAPGMARPCKECLQPISPRVARCSKYYTHRPSAVSASDS